MTHTWINFAGDNDTAWIDIDGPIGGAVLAYDVKQRLRSITAPQILITLNSEGGSVTEGTAIADAIRDLRRNGQHVTVRISGIAASIAAYIAMAADLVEITADSLFMVHYASSLAMGKAEELRAEAEALDRINSNLADTYAERTGQPVEVITELLEGPAGDGTTLSATEAVLHHFADVLLERTVTPTHKGAKNMAKRKNEQPEIPAKIEAPVAEEVTVKVEEIAEEPAEEIVKVEEIAEEPAAEADETEIVKIEELTRENEELKKQITTLTEQVAQLTAKADKATAFRRVMAPQANPLAAAPATWKDALKACAGDFAAAKAAYPELHAAVMKNA